MPQGTALLGLFHDSVGVYVRAGIRAETAYQETAQFTTIRSSFGARNG